MTRDEVLAARGVLCGVDLSCMDLCRMGLSYANLRDADLSRAILSCANLSYANLRCADLSYADLSGADLSGASLRGANLSHADLHCATLRGADLNAQSHDLLAEVLRQAAATTMQKSLAGLVLVARGWCWDDFLVCGHPEIEWGLAVLRKAGVEC